MNFLKKIDMFGAPLSLKLNQNAKYHTSWLGGVSTFIVYSLILIYAIINIRIWTIGNLLPTITTERSAILNQYIAPLSHLNITLRIHSYNDSAPQQDLDHQYVMIFLNFNNNSIATINDDGSYDFSLDFPDEGYSSQSQFYILTCDPSLIQTGTCVDKEIVEQTFNNNAYYASISFNLSYINPSNFEVSVVNQIIWVGFENGQTHSSSVNLGATLFEMQKPSVLQTKEQYYGFTSQKQYIETSSERYGIQSFLSEPGITYPYGHLYVFQFFSLDYVSDLVRIQYPSLFTVIGNIGAIAGILLYLQYLIIFYNTQQAEELMVDIIINKLFPKCEEIKIEKRFNKIQKVSYHDRIIDKEKYLQFHNKMAEKIQEYFSLPQIIVNQIEFHQYMNQLHPNYEYISSELDQLFQAEGLFNSSGELQNPTPNVLSVRSISQEPDCQSIR